MITRSEAIAELIAEGMPLELQTVEVHGNPLRVFKNAPDSLRDVLDFPYGSGAHRHPGARRSHFHPGRAPHAGEHSAQILSEETSEIGVICIIEIAVSMRR